MERTRWKGSRSVRCSTVVEIGQHKLMRSGNAILCRTVRVSRLGSSNATQTVLIARGGMGSMMIVLIPTDLPAIDCRYAEHLRTPEYNGSTHEVLYHVQDFRILSKLQKRFNSSLHSLAHQDIRSKPKPLMQ